MSDRYSRFIESQPAKLREKTRLYNDTAEERGNRIISYLGDVRGSMFSMSARAPAASRSRSPRPAPSSMP